MIELGLSLGPWTTSSCPILSCPVLPDWVSAPPCHQFLSHRITMYSLEAVLIDRALYLPTFSHVFIADNSLSLSLSLSLSVLDSWACCNEITRKSDKVVFFRISAPSPPGVKLRTALSLEPDMALYLPTFSYLLIVNKLFSPPPPPCCYCFCCKLNPLPPTPN